MRPVNIIEGIGFIDMLKEFNCDYNIPSRPTIMSIIVKMYDNDVCRLKEELSKTNFVSLTTDGWTSITATPFITMTASYIIDGVLISRVLQTLSFMVGVYEL